MAPKRIWLTDPTGQGRERPSGQGHLWHDDQFPKKKGGQASTGTGCLITCAAVAACAALGWAAAR